MAGAIRQLSGTHGQRRIHARLQRAQPDRASTIISANSARPPAMFRGRNCWASTTTARSINVGKNAVAPFNVYNLIPQTDPQGRPLEDVLGWLGPSQKLCQLVSASADPLERLHQGRLGHLPGAFMLISRGYTPTIPARSNVEPTVTSGLQIPTVPVTNPFIPGGIGGVPGDLYGLLQQRTGPTVNGVLAANQPFSLSERFYSVRLPHDHQPEPYLPVRRRPGRHPGRHHDLGRLWQPWPDHDRLCLAPARCASASFSNC